MKTKEIKTFEGIILKDKVLIGDPVYDERKFLLNIENMLPGEYISMLHYSNGFFNSQIVKTQIHFNKEFFGNKDEEELLNSTNRKKIGYIIVDSGQAGIFNEETFFTNRDNFYNNCCSTTLGKPYEQEVKVYNIKKDIENYKKGGEKLNNEILSDIKKLETELEHLEATREPYYMGGIVDSNSFVSFAGDGDGMYSVYGKTRKIDGIEKIVAIKIVF